MLTDALLTEPVATVREKIREIRADGGVITGTVVAIEKGFDGFAVVDVDAKTEGRVPVREFHGPGRENDIEVGDAVAVYVMRVENGGIVLSRDRARREESWGKLEKAFQDNEKVEGVISNQIKGGFTVDIKVDLDGFVAFLARSQVDIRPIRDITPLMDVSQSFRLLKVDRCRANITVSRRAVLEQTPAEQRQELVQYLEEGQVIDGVVTNITDYGAFVDLRCVDGFLHVTDIAWRRVNHPSEVLSVKQQVKVKILKINSETHRILLGMKQLKADPRQGIEAKFPVGAQFKGRVTAVGDYGATVELEPGIEGFLHVSEVSSAQKGADPREIWKISQEFTVRILRVDPVEHPILPLLLGL
jgi:small subunit ribosomal protein S1